MSEDAHLLQEFPHCYIDILIPKCITHDHRTSNKIEKIGLYLYVKGNPNTYTARFFKVYTFILCTPHKLCNNLGISLHNIKAIYLFHNRNY